MGNLSRPKTFGKLQKEVIKVLVRNLDADTIAALRELFTYLDKERSGLVSTADILHALEYGGTDIAKAELN